MGQVNITADGAPIRVGSGIITPNPLAVLGVNPALGRAFTGAEADSPPGTQTVVILSDELWRQRFGGRPVVGKTLGVDGMAREIVGVMPPAFQLPSDYVEHADQPTRIWLPLRLDPSSRRSRRWTTPHGRFARDRERGTARTHTDPHGRRALFPGDAVPGLRRTGHHRSLWQRANAHPPADGRGGVSAAHRLRERRQPPAGAI